MTLLRVVIADDQALVRAGFRMILDAEPDMEVVAEAADGESAVALVRKHHPDVVLMDIRMPQLDGLAATRQILERGGETPRILMLTTFDLDEYVYAALRGGANGFLLKDVSPEQLVMAVRTVAAGDALLAPTITRRLVERFSKPVARGGDGDLSKLTPRELEVFKLVARGGSNGAIAQSLSLSEETVKTHVARILPKLGLHNRAGAVVVAYERGVVRPGGA
jgi:DNA-binding NarL/FixJ family response regulator